MILEGDVLTETGSHYIPRLVLNFQSSCLSFLGGGITEVSHHAQLLACYFKSPKCAVRTDRAFPGIPWLFGSFITAAFNFAIQGDPYSG